MTGAGLHQGGEMRCGTEQGEAERKSTLLSEFFLGISARAKRFRAGDPYETRPSCRQSAWPPSTANIVHKCS